MPKAKLKGLVFGRWTVIEEDGVDKYRRLLWKCKCECGNIGIVSSACLLNGDSKSCGCLHKENLIGDVFGRFTIIDEAKTRRGSAFWTCECLCGKIKEVSAKALRSGKTKSCGCLRNEMIASVNFKHGMSESSEYNIWGLINKRCYKTDSDDYPDYGGRGIGVCDRCRGENGFENFYKDMGPRPSEHHSIDRYPDNENGWYGPENCRWGTDEQQTRNRRSNVWFEKNGIKMVMKDWANKLGVTQSAIIYHLRKGKSFDQIYSHFNSRLNAANNS